MYVGYYSGAIKALLRRRCVWDTVTGASPLSSSTCPSNSSPIHIYKEKEEEGEEEGEEEEEGEGGEEAAG